MLLTLLSCCVMTSAASDWGYSGNTGPSHWEGECQTGRSQSPVDLPRTNLTLIKEAKFVFDNYDSTPDEGKLENNGHTVKYSAKPVDKERAPKVSGGGLPSTFEFAQLHFHWGSKESVGSEHTIGKASFPMEVHLVHFNTKYGSDLGSAIAGGGGAYDTLAVLGIMFQLNPKPSAELQPLLDVFPKVRQPRSKAPTKLFPLKDFLPSETSTFYRYNGSLTTPGCNEIVVWTVFKNPIPISPAQLGLFRDLSVFSPSLKDNFRPPVALNGRKIYDVKTEDDDSKMNGANSSLGGVPWIGWIFTILSSIAYVHNNIAS